MKDIFINIINLIFPNTCINCQKSINAEEHLCHNCIKKIRFNRAPICKSCGRTLKFDQFKRECKFCATNNYSFERNYSLFQYKDPIIELIYSYKYKRFKKIKSFLFEHLSEFLKFYDIINKHNINIISSVPLHKSKLRERGYNQSELIARAIAEFVSLPYKETLLATKYTRSQTRIRYLDRQKKVKGAYKTKDNFCGTILLVDDVFTTGSTLNECSKLLKKNGADKVITLTICSTLK